MTLAKKQGRPDPHVLTPPWKLEDACPCGVTQAQYVKCCYNSDGLPLVRVPALQPRPPATGFAHERCFLNVTRDCSEKLSREHYISRTILEQLGGPISVTGFPWQADGETDVLGIGSMTAKVLCERHNNALSPIDGLAGAAFRSIAAATVHATKKSLTRRTAHYLASGDAIERWAVKTLLGVCHARIARSERKAVMDTHEIDLQRLAAALLGQGVDEPLGMYVSPDAGQRIDNKIGFAPLTAKTPRVVAGLRMMLRGLELDFIFDGRGANPHFFSENAYYRPGLIDFDGPQRTARLVVSWEKYRIKGRRVGLRLEAERSLRG